MLNVKFEAMNKEVFKILEDISNLNTDIETGWNKLLNLHLVSHSYYQVVHDCFDGDIAVVTAGLKTLEEAKQALEENKKHFDIPMYIIAKINCG